MRGKKKHNGKRERTSDREYGKARKEWVGWVRVSEDGGTNKKGQSDGARKN